MQQKNQAGDAAIEKEAVATPATGYDPRRTTRRDPIPNCIAIWVTLSAITAANDIDNLNQLEVGQEILIPSRVQLY